MIPALRSSSILRKIPLLGGFEFTGGVVLGVVRDDAIKGKDVNEGLGFDAGECHVSVVLDEYMLIRLRIVR
jgi:hypothetical protein